MRLPIGDILIEVIWRDTVVNASTYTLPGDLVPTITTAVYWIDFIVQDDSGIPVRDLEEWSYTLWGKYLKPFPYLKSTWRRYNQKELIRLSAKNTGTLPFNFGYASLVGLRNSSLIIVTV